MFWSCPQLVDYWNAIFLSESLNLILQPNAFMCIFGTHSDKDPDLNNKHKNAIALSTLLAHRRILMDWKSPRSPSSTVCVKDLMFLLKLEKIKISHRVNLINLVLLRAQIYNTLTN